MACNDWTWCVSEEGSLLCDQVESFVQFPAADSRKASPPKFMVVKIDPSYPFPTLIAQPKQFLPLEPDHTKGGKQWTDVSAVWKAKGVLNGPAATAAELWANVGKSMMGWDERKLADEKCTNKFMGALLEDLVDHIGDYYMWAPNLSGV